jgi:hypothetical protein
MRENRPYGLEGGEAGSTGLPYPYASHDRVGVFQQRDSPSEHPKHKNADATGLASEARRLRCLVTICNDFGEFREWSACEESHASVAGSDPLAPSIFEVIFEAF